MSENAQIPGPGKATDGISHMPGRAIVLHTNWRALKREFLLDENYENPRRWLYEVKQWPVKRIANGNTIKRIKGWGSDKAAFELKKTERLTEAMLREQQKRIPTLITAKLNLVAKIIQDVGRWDRLQPAEKKLCYEILKTELGEPKNIQGNANLTPKDPVEALLEEYGLMREGRVIIDVEQTSGTEHSQAPATNGSGSPTEVSSGQAV